MTSAKAISFLFLVTLPAVAARAQNPASHLPATFASTSAQSVPSANPGRPTFTNPADLTPVGYLQFEQGFIAATDSPGLDRQFSVAQVTKLTVHPRLMLQFSTQPLAFSSLNPGTSRDTGDLGIAVQAILHRRAGRIPTIAAGYQEVVRGGSAPSLDLGSSTRSAIILISGDIGATHYDTNYTLSQQTLDLPQAPSLRRAQFGQTLCVSHPLFASHNGGKLILSGEIWHATQPLPQTDRHNTPVARANAVGALAAVSYAIAPNLVVDTALNRGFTSTSTAWQYLGGFTYLLPHRLW